MTTFRIKLALKSRLFRFVFMLGIATSGLMSCGSDKDEPTKPIDPIDPYKRCERGVCD
jgi:hypothetical protein